MSLTSYRAAPPRGGMISWTGRPGGGLLSRALRHSTMGAGGFHGRVRDGIGCGPPAKATRSSSPSNDWADQGSGELCAEYLSMISMHGVILSSIGRLGP